MRSRAPLAPLSTRSGSAALALAFGLALGLAGCRGGAAEQPLVGDLELCCKSANPDEVSFVGCRAADVCRATEEVWIRGPLTCTVDGPEQCAGGRCCSLDLDALALRAGPGMPSPTPTDPSDGVDEPVPVEVPEPAPVTPIPLDWSGRPTPVFIPKLVCPATDDRGVTGAVVLWLEIDATGRVTEAAIRESLDPECDALARDALLHAEFEPGLNPDGQPIATALRYRYEFTASPTP